MKILFVTKHYGPGAGDRTYMFGLEKILRDKGHQIAYFAMDHPSNLPTPFSEYFVSRIDFADLKKNMGPVSALRVLGRSIYSFESRKRISHLLDAYKPDLVHIQHLDAHISYSILPAIKKKGIPIVWTLHIYAPFCINYNFVDPNRGEICDVCKTGKFYRAAIRRCKKGSLAASLAGMLVQYFNHGFRLLDHVDLFLCPSEFIRGIFAQGGFPSQKLLHLPNFTALDGIEPSYEGGQYGLFLGRLDPEKGVSLLLSALEGTRIPFKIVGELDGHSRLLKEAENKGLDRVDFTGFKVGSELSKIISGAKFIVVPSLWYEVFGLVILEAYAHGKPVVASRMGGIPEVVEEGETGYIFDPNRPEALREKMIDLYENNEKAIVMGRKGRARTESVYNPALHYSRLMEIYNSLS